MELFTLYADGEGIRARFLVHLSDFTTAEGDVDEAFLADSVAAPADVGHFLFAKNEALIGRLEPGFLAFCFDAPFTRTKRSNGTLSRPAG